MHHGTALPGLWADIALRPYLGDVRRRSKQFTSFSSVDDGIRNLRCHYSPIKAYGDKHKPVGAYGVLLSLVHTPHIVLTTKYAGMSMLGKFIAYELSAGKVDNLPKELEDFLPIHVDLAALECHYFKGSASFSCVVTDLYEPLVQRGQSSFQDRLAHGGSVVILDNLDNLEPAKKVLVFEWIDEIRAMGNKVVVASRKPLQPGLSGMTTFEVAAIDTQMAMLIASRRLNQVSQLPAFAKIFVKSIELQDLAKHHVSLDMLLDVFIETGKLPSDEFTLAEESMKIATKRLRQKAPARMAVSDHLQKSWLSLAGFNLHLFSTAGLDPLASETMLCGWMEEILGEGSQRTVLSNVDAFLAHVSIFRRGGNRGEYGFASRALMTASAAHYVVSQVVSPRFVRDQKSQKGISKKMIGDWAKNPDWRKVMYSVETILRRDYSAEWLDEFKNAALSCNGPKHCLDEETLP